MANKKRKNNTKPIYNRGIARKILKFQMHTNKIKSVWHQIKGDVIKR